MDYNGITWGPSMRGYRADNKCRIGKCQQSLALLQNQTGQFADEHRMLLAFFADLDVLIDKHISMADAAALAKAEGR